MLRWKYVGPRLFLLIAFCVAVYYGANPLLRLVLIQAGQSATGARVEIGAVNASLARGNIELQQLTMADPDHPARNLLEIGRANFDLETSMILHRKWVIREGTIDKMVLYTDRETSGELEKSPDTANESSAVSDAIKKMEDRGTQWLEGSLDRFETEFDTELETVKLGRELADRWPQEYATIESQSKELELQVRQIRDMIKEVKEKPLEHLDKVKPLLASADKTRKDVADLRFRIQQLHAQMKSDRAALDIARRHDTEYLRQRLKIDELDGNSLSEYLLGPVWGPRVEWAVRWIQRSRQMMATESDQVAQASRGVNFLFPGIPSTADVLIRKLNLSGEGTANSQPYSFAGTVYDLTHQPRRHDKPTTVALRSSGAIQLTARGTLDRRGDQPLDQWVVDIPAWRQNGETLGRPERFAVNIAPGIARIHAEFTIHEDTLEGQVLVRQDQLQLQPVMSPRYTKYVSRESLQAAVEGVRQLQAELTISGNLLRPKYRLKSNLGPHLASGLNRAVKQELAAKEQQLMAKAHEEVDAELDKLQDKLVADHGKILERLEMGDEQMEQLRTQLMAHVGSPSDLLRRGKKLFK